MKKLLILIPMLAMLTSAIFSPPPVVAFAQEQYNSAVEQVESVRNTAADDEDEEEEQIGIEELLSELDISELDEYFKSMPDNSRELFGTGLKDWLVKVANGEFKFEYSSFVKYALSTLGESVASTLPILLSIIAIAILISIVGGIKGSFASKSTDAVVNFAGITLVSILVLIEIFGVIRDVKSMVEAVRTQSEIVFPILFTLMTALGASGSIAIYQPAVAIFAISITELVTSLALPALIVAVVFSIVGNLSGTVKLGGAAKFCLSAAKWVLYTTFFLFLAFLSVQGITAAIYDNVSVRAAKFALSKYVPIIGGYLSEGFNVILAGSVLIKNAVGMTAVLILMMTVVPILIKIIVVSLSLKLAGAITEPLEGGKITSLLNSISGAINLLIAVVCGLAFIYFVFLILLIASGNLVL